MINLNKILGIRVPPNTKIKKETIIQKTTYLGIWFIDMERNKELVKFYIER